ncbi:hypothetical protein NSMS1_66490 (plasmid) [Nostoc sp. MS1]|nr:hypothetical protein NSMS1_66490 [Nostoc sp. MS1]
MIITIASFKGGVGKSTTAIHLAAYLATKGKTVLADGDLNRSVLHWFERGKSPFNVYDHSEIDQADDFEHLVIDTPARPASDELKALAKSSDLLIIPTHPSTFALEALIETVGELNELPPGRFKVLLTCVPPSPAVTDTKPKKVLKNLAYPCLKLGSEEWQFT